MSKPDLRVVDPILSNRSRGLIHTALGWCHDGDTARVGEVGVGETDAAVEEAVGTGEDPELDHDFK